MTSVEVVGRLKSRLVGNAIPLFALGTTLSSGVLVGLTWATRISWILMLIPLAHGLVAVFCSLRAGESQPLRELIGSLFTVRVAGRWLAVAMLALPLTIALAYLLRVIVGAADLTFGAPDLIPIAVALPFAMFNELGWRGFASKHIPDKIGLFVNSVIVGVLWVVSIAPVFILGSETLAGITLLQAALLLLPISTLLTWLNANAKSLLMCAWFIASGVIVALLLSVLPVGASQGLTVWLIIGFLWLAAGAVVGHYGTDGLDHSIRELPPDELPVQWDKIMPMAGASRKQSALGSLRGRRGRKPRSFASVGGKRKH